MKSYEEVARDVFRRRDEYVSRKYNREPSAKQLPGALSMAAMVAILVLSLGAGYWVIRNNADSDIHNTDPTETSTQEPSETEETTEETTVDPFEAEIFADMMAGFTPFDEIPEMYPSDYVAEEGGIPMDYGDVYEPGTEVIQEFVERSQNGEAAYARIGDYNTGGKTRTIYDMIYDGEVYWIRWMENGTVMVEEYKYLVYYEGQEESRSEYGDHDEFERYVLVNDDTLTWEEVGEAAHKVVYSNVTTYKKKAQILQEPVKAVLEFGGRAYVTVTDANRLQDIYDLFANAEVIGYEPKTHSIGMGLNLILTNQAGETQVIELDPDDDLCRIDGEYYHYGVYDEPSYIDKLWECLGITKWPVDF